MHRSKIAQLFDHLVGNGEQPRRKGEAERFGSLEVNDQLKRGRLDDREIGRLRALENLAEARRAPCRAGLKSRKKGCQG
jgi:hypothetical protein